MSTMKSNKGAFGTAAVFMTAISTILGAILFLRFGYAVGHTGFVGTLAIILIGHLVTIPTALAVAEIATNQKVEGGGAYYMISRSFGINIGGAIGIALFLSQAISVAFYVIAFAEAFGPFIDYLSQLYPQYKTLIQDKRFISVPTLAILALIMLTKGADIGVKALYVVVSILFLSLLMFFMGSHEGALDASQIDLTLKITKPDSFFYVFTIIFPAFTGIAAGLGLSGDLKDPKKAIPRGTLLATFVGIVVYVLVAYKLAINGSPQELADDQLFMQKIALWGPIIPIGLACATVSSALGSIMIAPRTLQALGGDKSFPLNTINEFLSKERKNEPINATAITLLIALVFCLIGDVDFVARIISVFFMVTYGAICLISFLEHFAADPSYRPTFKSRWWLSSFGAVLCFYLIFKMDFWYALISILIMIGFYFFVSYFNPYKNAMSKIFKGVLFQLTRRMHVMLQSASEEEESEGGWRPFVVCISKDTFHRFMAFNMVRWISHKYGFGTYIHYIEGYLNKDTHKEAEETLKKLLKMGEISKSKVYVDTIISPSYTSAIAQVIQLPGISGNENNMMFFEYSRREPEALQEVLNNFKLLEAVNYDVCILGSTDKGFGYRRNIHIWITPEDYDNANLMILMAYILLGHPEWRDGVIKLHALFPEEELKAQKENLTSMMATGRIPISANNIELISRKQETNDKHVINKYSADADLCILGFNASAEDRTKAQTADFDGYSKLGNILFVNTNQEKEIK